MAAAIILCVIGFAVFNLTATKALMLTVVCIGALCGGSLLTFLYFSFFVPVAFLAFVGVPALLGIRLAVIGVRNHLS